MFIVSSAAVRHGNLGRGDKLPFAQLYLINSDRRNVLVFQIHILITVIVEVDAYDFTKLL